MFCKLNLRTEPGTQIEKQNEPQRRKRETLQEEVAIEIGDSALLEVDLLVTCATVGTDGHFRGSLDSTCQILSFI